MPSPFKSEKKGDGENHHQRKDPYVVLGVAGNSTDQEIKSAYRRMALKYHPDKNLNDPIASDMFKEVTFSYNILSDPNKRRQYDTSGFEAIESDSQELELDLSSLGTMNTMFAALFSKLGVPIKTTVSATVLEEALNGTVDVRPLQFGQSLCRKVEKQCAHFYSVQITEQEAQMGFVCRVHAADKSKFKLLYFEMEEDGGSVLHYRRISSPIVAGIPNKEDSTKTGNVTSAGMFFLCFPVYRLDPTNSMAVNKDPDASFFKKLEGFQPCEINELKAGTHVFAVYGDNFFKSASYAIEVMCAEPFSEEKERLRAVEAKLLTKRAELSKFESEYREVLARFTEMTSRYAEEMHTIDELLKERNDIHGSYTTIPPLKRSLSGGRIRSSFRASRNEEKKRDRSKKKRWFNIQLKVDNRKPC